MRDYKKLAVCKKSHEMYMFINKNISNKLPKEERYELNSQLMRAALSVPLNIVEGCGRFIDKDFTHFLDTSLGFANEVDYCCFAASECNYLTQEKYAQANRLINEVRAMLISFIKILRTDK